MTEFTDPIRELVDTIELFANEAVTSTPALTIMSTILKYDDDSHAFFEFLTILHGRIIDVRALISILDIDEDLRDSALEVLNQVRTIFSQPPASAPVAYAFAKTKLERQNTGPLRLLSSLARQKISYPKLSDDEISELAAEVAQLIEWLEEHQLQNHDFIRCALIEGLRKAAFRLQHFKSFGRGYTVESLREIMSAYMALETMALDPAINPDAEAMLRKTAAVCGKIFEKFKLAKEVTETGAWGLTLYAAAAIALAPLPAKIAGLLN